MKTLVTIFLSILIISLVECKWQSGCEENGITKDESCYQPIMEKKSYLSAVSECLNMGGTLGMMKNSLIQAQIAESYRKAGLQIQFWAGITDHDLEGTFRYYDGTTLGPFRPWKQNEPDNGIPPNGHYLDYEPEDCVVVNSQELWIDEICRYEYYFACEFKRDHIPCNTDKIIIRNAEFQYCSNEVMVPYGTSISIKCYEGFVLIGQNNIICLADGEWSLVPQCVQGCPSPDVLPNATMLYIKDMYALGDRITYICDEGYVTTINKHKTHSQITCSSDEKWLPEKAGCSLEEKYTVGLMEVERENSISLPCVAKLESEVMQDSDNNVWFLWLKNSEDINKTKIDYSIDKDGTLVIHNMSDEAVGQYICFIANEQLEPAAMGFEVKLKPEFCPPCPNQTETATFWEGSSAVFKCPHTISDEEFTWFKNGHRYYVHSDQTIFPDGSMYTSSLQYLDQGCYICQMMKKESLCECNHTIDITVRVSTKTACGVSNPDSPHPWAVLLWQRGEITPFCYGSLINERWVVTSAQCLAGYQRKRRLNMFVRFASGKINITMDGNYSRSDIKDFGVKTVKVHPRYSKNMYVNDIGVIQLARPVLYSDSIRPICVTDKDLARKNPCERSGSINGTVVGWGTLDNDNYEQLVMLNESMFVEVTDSCFNTNHSYLGKLMCARKQNYANTTLAGDTGSPFEIFWNEKFHLLGVYTWGERAASLGEHDYFTKISDHYTWLKNLTEVSDTEQMQYGTSIIQETYNDRKKRTVC